MESNNKKIRGAKSGEFEGIKYRSQLEIRIAKFLKSKNIPFEYESIRLELLPSIKYNGQTLKSVHYTPDFKCGDYLIEAKGYPNDSWSLKKKLIIKTIMDKSLPYKFREVHSIQELNKVLSEMHGLEEEWRPVAGFEKLYEVSNLGNVRSIQFHGKKRLKLMTLTSDKRGYKYVKLRDWSNSTGKPYQVHGLVAEAFLPNPDNRPQVDHIDTDPSNNVVTNLRWVTVPENQNNPITLDRLRRNICKYNKSQQHKIDIQEAKGHPVIQLSQSGEILNRFPSINEAAIHLSTTASCIKRVCDGERKHHGKFIFRYE